MDVLPRGFRLPIKAGIDDDALRHEGGAVAVVEGTIIARLHLVAEHSRIPREPARMGTRVRIQQQLVRVETVACVRLIGALDAIAVPGAGSDARNIAMKDLVGEFRQLEAVRFALTFE